MKGKTKQILIPIRGGYKIKPEIIDISPCLVAGYYKTTNSFGYPYVMIVEQSDEDTERDKTRLD